MEGPGMTCRAGIRVLYELAGGTKATWEGLERTCGMKPGTAKRIFARNDNWPRNFGPLDYGELVDSYASEYATPYGALTCVKDTLRKYGAYTDEVARIADGVGARDSDEDVAACLRALSDVIYATARPASRAAGNDRESKGPRVEAPAAPGAPGLTANERGEKKLAGEGSAVRPAAIGSADPPAPTGEGRAPRVAIADGAGEPAPAVRPAGDLTFARLHAALCAPDLPPLDVTCADGAALARALLPRDVGDDLVSEGLLDEVAAQGCPAPEARVLASRLGADGGLRLREMLARCREALRAADPAAFHEAARALAAEHARGQAPDAPDALRDPLGFTAARVDGSPAAQLLALALVALLGGPMAARVLTRASRERLLVR